MNAAKNIYNSPAAQQTLGAETAPNALPVCLSETSSSPFWPFLNSPEAPKHTHGHQTNASSSYDSITGKHWVVPLMCVSLFRL